MKLPLVSRPLLAALCGFSLAALPGASIAQERTRDERPRENAPREERPTEGQRPPRGESRPGENPRGETRPTETRRDDAPRGERGEARPADGQRGEFRPGEGQRGQPQGQFNPQELFRDLNDDQRAALRGFFEANQHVMREIGERSMRLRREIAESAMADKPNEGLIREKIMQAAQLEAEATITRARAFAQVREKLPKQTVERLRGMVAGMGPRGGVQPPMQGGPDARREGGDVRRPAGEGDLRRPPTPREEDKTRRPAAEGDRRPEPAERKPAGEGDRRPEATDRKPRVEGDRGPRPDGDRAPRPEGDRKPEPPRRPPADQ
ncbi:MAG: hypothetical protein RL514_1350 [Verrucomicrobiota bacterium]